MKGSDSERDDLTAEQRWELHNQKYWQSALFPVEWSSASILAGLEFPVVGGRVGPTLDHAIATAVAMFEHPDPDLRWTADVSIVLASRIAAIVRMTDAGPQVLRFDDHLPPLPPQKILPGRRASRSHSLIFIDGSLDSTCCGLGAPLAGRDLSVALEDLIRTIVETTGRRGPVGGEPEDAAISFLGRFLAVIRHTPSGPEITRFDQPGAIPNTTLRSRRAQ